MANEFPEATAGTAVDQIRKRVGDGYHMAARWQIFEDVRTLLRRYGELRSIALAALRDLESQIERDVLIGSVTYEDDHVYAPTVQQLRAALHPQPEDVK